MIKSLISKVAIFASAFLLCLGTASASITFVVKENNLGIRPTGEVIHNFPLLDISYQQNPSSVVFSPNHNGPDLTDIPMRGDVGIDVGSSNMSACTVTVNALLFKDQNNKPNFLDVEGYSSLSIQPKNINYVCNASISATDTVSISVYKVA